MTTNQPLPASIRPSAFDNVTGATLKLVGYIGVALSLILGAVAVANMSKSADTFGDSIAHYETFQKLQVGATVALIPLLLSILVIAAGAIIERLPAPEKPSVPAMNNPGEL